MTLQKGRLEAFLSFVPFSAKNLAKLLIFPQKTMIFINFLRKMQKSLKKIWWYETFFLNFASSNL